MSSGVPRRSGGGHRAQCRAGEEGLWWRLIPTALWGLQARPFLKGWAAPVRFLGHQQPQTCVSPTAWLSGVPSSPTPHPWPRDLRALDPPAKCPPGPATGPEGPSCTGQMLSPRGWPDAPRGEVASGSQQGREPSPERQHPMLLPGWGPTTGRGQPALGGGGGTAQWAL